MQCTFDSDPFLIGTHWSWEILNMLVNGKAEYKKVTKRALEPELLTNMKYLDKEKSPRVINTHLPFRWLPQQHVQNGGKFIHVMRNPKDLFVSLYHYFKTAVAPFIGSNLEELTWNDFFHIFITGNSASTYLPKGSLTIRPFSSPRLKNILVNCSAFTFLLNFSFMK